MQLNEETKITVCMAQSPDGVSRYRQESEDDPREELDVKPNTGVPVEVSSFPTSGKGNIACGETEWDPENESNVGHALRNIDGGVGDSKVIGSGSERIHKPECAGNSGKRRRSRWGPEQCETGENEVTNKIRKTRWDDSELKMLGPTNLPNFLKSFNGSELDPKISRLRTKLMDINSRLGSSELQDDRPEEERSPSPEPVYDNLGMRINTREVRLLKKLTAQRSRIISKLAKMNPTFRTPFKPKLTKFSEPKLTKLSRKLYVPVKEYPAYNFIGLIIGPRGNTQKKMEKETGAKIHLRGKGSQRTSQEPGPTDNEDLHVYVEADNKKSLDDAVAMIEKLLIPVADRLNSHKRAQLAELARLIVYKDENKCNICKEEGHREYACPSRKSTFEGVCCDSCGSFCHPTTKCPLSISSQKCEPSWNFSGLGTGSTVNIEDKSHKEIDVRNLYVGYLSQTIDSNRLKELFLPFGKVTEAKVIEDRYTGLSKGYGFVTFEDVTDAAGAVAYMNGYEMDGKCLAVGVAGHAAVADHLLLSDLSILSGTTSVLSSSQWQATSLPLTDTVMLPQAQSSVFNSEGSVSFPSSSACFGSFVGSTVTSISPPFYQHPNDDDDMEFASQFPGYGKYQKSTFHSHLHKPIMETSPAFHLDTMPESSKPRDSFWSTSHFV